MCRFGKRHLRPCQSGEEICPIRPARGGIPAGYWRMAYVVRCGSLKAMLAKSIIFAKNIIKNSDFTNRCAFSQDGDIAFVRKKRKERLSLIWLSKREGVLRRKAPCSEVPWCDDSYPFPYNTEGVDGNRALFQPCFWTEERKWIFFLC